jgi:hypothetical protein
VIKGLAGVLEFSPSLAARGRHKGFDLPDLMPSFCGDPTPRKGQLK